MNARKEPVPQAPEPLAGPLNSRELTALHLVAEGLSYELVAVRMQVARSTVAGYLTQAYRKLGGFNNVNAVAIAVQSGLVSVEVPDG